MIGDGNGDRQIYQSRDVMIEISVPLGAEIRRLNVKGCSHQTPSYSAKYASWYLFSAAKTDSSSE
jgi:hypothetical protein